MKTIAAIFVVVGVCAAAPTTAPVSGMKVVYSEDFQDVKGENAPSDMMVLGGTFKIAGEEGNRFLRSAGDPIETTGLLVGPENPNATAIHARIRSGSTGKRTPEFGVGLGGAGGYVLWVRPAVRQVQLVCDEEVKGTAEYEWHSGEWTNLRLAMRRVGDRKWRVEARAWAWGKAEPGEWQISVVQTEPPPTGRASVWGVPFSEKAIDFDDVVVWGAE